VSGAHSQRGHALLSPSGSSIWLNCPRSAVLSRGVPRKSSKWADEGTLAHELAEYLLKGAIPHHKVGTFPDDMAEPVEVYTDYVNELRRVVLMERIEDRVNLSGLWPDDGEGLEPVFGTADYVGVTKDGVLHVVDLKYGRYHPVEVGGNTQLMIYALGAWLAMRDRLERNGLPLAVRQIEMAIVQPRAKHGDGPIRSAEIDLADLLVWAYDVLVPAVEAISTLDGDDLPIKEGSHCRWCAAASTVCPVKRQTRQDEARNLFDEIEE
jgi:hypothetical protein